MIKKQEIPTLEQALSGTLFGKQIPKTNTKEIVKFDPEDLVEISDQPFRLYAPEKLQELAEDIKLNGQISPCIIRKKDGQHIVLAGRNRKRACSLAGVQVEGLVVECDDATANLIVVNSNMLQRLELLPSEKAFGYKLQKESYEAKGQRKSTAAVAEQNSENIKLIQRYIKLTDLSKDLLDMVDQGRLPVTVGVELSYLQPHNMEVVSSYLQSRAEQMVSVQQAQELHKLNNEGDFDIYLLDKVFGNKQSDTEQSVEDTAESENTPTKPEGKKTSVSIKLKDLEQIPCLFNFDEADSKEIQEFIINSLTQYFSGKSIT